MAWFFGLFSFLFLIGGCILEAEELSDLIAERGLSAFFPLRRDPLGGDVVNRTERERYNGTRKADHIVRHAEVRGWQRKEQRFRAQLQEVSGLLGSVKCLPEQGCLARQRGVVACRWEQQ
uniref:Putative secreted protein n=1 Tax=Anopheles triannulatus TaxID=58253 RepID=A0A2M4B3H2_9DIPT